LFDLGDRLDAVPRLHGAQGLEVVGRRYGGDGRSPAGSRCVVLEDQITIGTVAKATEQPARPAPTASQSARTQDALAAETQKNKTGVTRSPTRTSSPVRRSSHSLPLRARRRPSSVERVHPARSRKNERRGTVRFRGSPQPNERYSGAMSDSGRRGLGEPVATIQSWCAARVAAMWRRWRASSSDG